MLLLTIDVLSLSISRKSHILLLVNPKGDFFFLFKSNKVIQMAMDEIGDV